MRTNGFQGQVTIFCKVETYATKAGYFRREVITYMLLLILSHQKTLLPVEHYLNSIHEKKRLRGRNILSCVGKNSKV